MVTPKIYNELDADERKLWHSHVFEVKSGMLIMPAPAGVPDAVWEVAENKEMEEVVHLYGKNLVTYLLESMADPSFHLQAKFSSSGKPIVATKFLLASQS